MLPDNASAGSERAGDTVRRNILMFARMRSAISKLSGDQAAPAPSRGGARTPPPHVSFS